MARIAVVGLGKVGLPTACHLAERLGHEVRGYDANVRYRERLLAGENPLPWEPGVDLGLIRVTTTLREAVRGVEAVVVLVPTPALAGTLSSGMVLSVLRDLEDLEYGRTVIVMSTLDPRATREVCRLESAVYFPPLIALGHVRRDLEQAALQLVGAWPEAREAEHALSLFYPRGLDRVRVIRGDPVSVAAAKLAINATLSARVAWANDLATTAEAFEADARVVVAAVRADPRIGPLYMTPGPSPGGPCLPRDLEVWASLDHGLAATTIVAHSKATSRLLLRAQSWLRAQEAHDILILGATYNAGALDVTGSLGLALLRSLQSWEDVRVRLHDPALPYLGLDLGHLAVEDPAQAIRTADAVVLATRWPAFAALDLGGRPVLDLAWEKP